MMILTRALFILGLLGSSTGLPGQALRAPRIAQGVHLGFNAKGTVDSSTQLRVVETAFQAMDPTTVQSWTLRITGGTRSQTDFPADWPDSLIQGWVSLQRKYGFQFVYVVNGNDTPASQAAFVGKWISAGARFAFLEMMNEYYLQKYRNGDTSFDEVTRAVSAAQYVTDILPAFTQPLERFGLPFFIILAPVKQTGAAGANLRLWNDTVIQALRTTYADKRYGVTVHLYAEKGEPFDYAQIAKLRASLPARTPIAVTEAGATGYTIAAEKATATADHLRSIAEQLQPGDYLLEQILFKGNSEGFEGTLEPSGITTKGRAVFDLYSAAARAANPIPAKAFSKLLGAGFSTNWFKTAQPLSNYQRKNIEDVHGAGFQNLRLRARADLFPPSGGPNFTRFLDQLETVVDDCLKVGVIPVISWIHDEAERDGTDAQRNEYVAWWRAVAARLRDKDHRLAFNLFTELGDYGDRFPDSLNRRPDKYNRWTQEAIAAIRAAGGQNSTRIIILGSPGKKGDELNLIDPASYRSDPYLMAEFHLYASGPNQEGGQKNWVGNGSPSDRANVTTALAPALRFSRSSGIPTYFGAWMPWDNGRGSLTETEVIAFANFMIGELSKAGLPWTLNVLDAYYDTRRAAWLSGRQMIEGQPIDVGRVLAEISKAMRRAALAPQLGSVTVAGGFGAGAEIASGTWIELYGERLAHADRLWASADFVNGRAPVSLGDVRVQVAERNAYLQYVSPSQINALVPDGVPRGVVEVSVTTPDGSTSYFEVDAANQAPALLAPPAFRAGDRQFAVALLADGTFCGRAGQIPGATMRPARVGERLVLYGIGFGTVHPDVPTGTVAPGPAAVSGIKISLNGVDCLIEYAGQVPGSVGLYQFNIVVPAAVKGDVPLSVSAAGVALKQLLWVATE